MRRTATLATLAMLIGAGLLLQAAPVLADDASGPPPDDGSQALRLFPGAA